MVIVLRPEAERDLAEATRWYDDQQQGLGDEFLAGIGAILTRIDAGPQRYPLAGSFRRAAVRRFPYLVYYRAEATRIVVFAILHQRRDPKIVMRRSQDC